MQQARSWKAVLLIDEADVFIRARGESLIQNAIVGIFLRQLEYYPGVLFMTTNRSTDIDDAIMNRAAAVFEFNEPTDSEKVQIWSLHNEVMNANISKSDLREAQSIKVSNGRALKNLIALSLRSVMSEDRDTVTIDDIKLIEDSVAK